MMHTRAVINYASLELFRDDARALVAGLMRGVAASPAGRLPICITAAHVSYSSSLRGWGPAMVLLAGGPAYSSEYMDGDDTLCVVRVADDRLSVKSAGSELELELAQPGSIDAALRAMSDAVMKRYAPFLVREPDR